MRNRFRYFAPRASNAATYGIALTLLLAARAHWADLWPTLTSLVPMPVLFVGGGFVFYIVWFWGVAGLYHLAETRGVIESWRIQQRPRQHPARRGPSWSAAIRVVLRNQFFGTLPALVVFYGLLVLRGVELTGPVPGASTVLWQLAVIVLVEEVLFYAVHRTMHRPALFRRFHRIHHEFRETVSIATHYVHPVEHLLGNLLPVFAGPLLVGAHPVTIAIWVGIAVTNALHTHAGFALPWMSWGVDHDFHHFNIRGSYGAIGLLDRILGTDKELRAAAADQTEEAT